MIKEVAWYSGSFTELKIRGLGVQICHSIHTPMYKTGKCWANNDCWAHREGEGEKERKREQEGERARERE